MPSRSVTGSLLCRVKTAPSWNKGPMQGGTCAWDPNSQKEEAIELGHW